MQKNSYDKIVEISKNKRIPDEFVFVEKSTYARHHIKRRVLEQKLIPYKCNDCGISGDWNNKPLVLQLDHKNGINNDHRLENLGFLCPNCHSQTLTYAAKNRKNKKRNPKKYLDKNGVVRNIDGKW